MAKTKIFITALILFGLFGLAKSSEAATYTCTGTADQNGISAAIAAAPAGGTVTVAPTPECNFSGRVNLQKSGGINLIFQGTSITGTLSGEFFYLLAPSSAANYRLSGFVMNGTPGEYVIKVGGSLSNFVVDNITDNSGRKFMEIGGIDGMWSYTYEGGVEPKQKVLIQSITKKNGQFLKAYGRGFLAWADDDNWGTDDFIIIENCNLSYDTFPSGGMIDGENGAKFVFRYNDVTNGWFTYHDAGGPRYRGSRAFEIYNNKFTCNNSSCSSYYPAIHWRGGTGLVYNNVATASASKPFFGYEIYRVSWNNSWFSSPYKCADSGTLTMCRDAWRHCVGGANDGKLCYFYGSCVGGTNPGASCNSGGDCLGGGTCTGTPPGCAGAPCSPNGCTSDNGCKDYYGKPDHCFVIDGGGTGNYPCRDQNGRGKEDITTGTQALQPAYFWGNYFNGVLTGFNDVATYILSDRDYCNHDPGSSCGSKPAWTYTKRTCPDPRIDPLQKGSCDESKVGTAGYSLAISDGSGDTTAPAVPSGLSIK